MLNKMKIATFKMRGASLGRRKAFTRLETEEFQKKSNLTNNKIKKKQISWTWMSLLENRYKKLMFRIEATLNTFLLLKIILQFY